MIVGVVMVTTVIYFFISGVLLSLVISLLMLAILGIVLCEQIRSKKQDGQSKSEFYFWFFICLLIFQLAVTIVLIASGNFTFTV